MKYKIEKNEALKNLIKGYDYIGVSTSQAGIKVELRTFRNGDTDKVEIIEMSKNDLVSLLKSKDIN